MCPLVPGLGTGILSVKPFSVSAGVVEGLALEPMPGSWKRRSGLRCRRKVPGRMREVEVRKDVFSGVKPRAVLKSP